MEIALLVVVGIGVGILSALLGVGGGILLVPFMVLVAGYDQHLAQGTSLAVIIPTAVVGALAHQKRGFVEVKMAAFMGIGGAAAVYAGSQIALATAAETLRLFFALVVIVLGLRLTVQGARLGRSSEP